jgi:Tfp pilus assembly protein FimT
MAHRGRTTWTTKFFLGPLMMMGMHKSKANLTTTRKGGGFSAIELLITATVLTIITGLGLMGITRARAAVRLSGAAREYASYIEKARVYSIRRHADNAGQRANVAINANKTSYNVTMDLDGDGGMDSRTIPLPEGVSFERVETIGFDWRGRTWNTVNGDTRSNAQVSITMIGANNNTVTIDVTGSGDITIDSRVYDDEVPNVNLRVGNLAAGATPVPTPGSITPTPTPVTPSTEVNPVPSPSPNPDGGAISLPTATPTPTPTATATPTPTPTPTPTATPTPTPTPTPLVCTITTDQALIIVQEDKTATIKVGVTSNGIVSITATSSNSKELQVTGGSSTLGSGSFTDFSIKGKKAGTYTVTFSSSCDSKTVSVTILPKLL